MKDFTEKIELVGKIEEGKESRTIHFGILKADGISENGRLYPRVIVEAQAARIAGLPFMLDHNDNLTVREIVARGISGRMQGDLLVGSFKFSKDVELSEQIFQSFKSGLVTDVSIRAHGESEFTKLPNGREVQKVMALELFSLDAVVQGGVPEAKVLQIIESSKTKEELNGYIFEQAYNLFKHDEESEKLIELATDIIRENKNLKTKADVDTAILKLRKLKNVCQYSGEPVFEGETHINDVLASSAIPKKDKLGILKSLFDHDGQNGKH